MNSNDLKSRMLDELDNILPGVKDAQPGDITSHDIMGRNGWSKSRSYNYIIKVAKELPDKYDRILAIMPGDTKGSYVLRPKNV